MDIKQILDDQVIHIKRGRSNSFGFEPLWNAYFDFYLDRRYFGQPLLEMGDVTFHLYLRKNINDRNPSWKMPTIRQIKEKFGIGNGKIYAMLERLEKAHLLTTTSGARVGTPNERNDYILSDPIATLAEFIGVATEGIFGRELLPAYKIASQHENQHVPTLGTRVPKIEISDVLEMGTCHVSEMGTDQQTLNTQHTLQEQLDPRLEELRFSIGEKTFDRWLNGAQILSTEDNTAVIGTPLAYARDWIENRLSAKIGRALGVDAVRCVVVEQE